MKKYLCLLILVLPLSLRTYSQDEKASIGIKGGLNIATLSNLSSGSAGLGGTSSSVSNSPLLLPHLGAYSEIKVSGIFSIQPEVLFTMKGYHTNSKVTSGGNSSESDYSLKLSYIDIPVQMRFNLGKGFHILGGPYVGFLLGATSTSKVTVNGSTSKSSDSNTNGFNSTQFGMYLGLGYELKQGLNFGLRWCKGFSSLVTNYNSNTTSVFQISIGYKLKSF